MTIVLLEHLYYNIDKPSKVQIVFALASRSYIDMWKFVLTSCIKRDFVHLGWHDQILDEGKGWHQVGYLIGVDISPSRNLNWILGTTVHSLDIYFYQKS